MTRIIAEGKTFAVDECTSFVRVDFHSGRLGQRSVSVPTAATKRTIFYPHSMHQERRLAGQSRLLDDLLVTKFDGYCGNGEFIWTPGGMLAAPALT
jgi:hypothetical protein